jgi:predicted amidohydrolase
MADQALPVLNRVEPWARDPRAMPRALDESPRRLTLAANGTGFCAGGYSLRYAGIQPGQAYRVQVDVEHQGLEQPADTLVAYLHWGDLEPDDYRNRRREPWDFLIPTPLDEGRIRFQRVARAPEAATMLTVRYVFRWARAGSSIWSLPSIEPCDLDEPTSVKVAAVTGVEREFFSVTTLPERVAYFARLCDGACADGARLLVLPEIGLQHGLEGLAYDLAIPIPGPEMAPIADVARRWKAHIILGATEREGDARYNTAALIDPRGEVAGKYRKVQLAMFETMSGIMPGDDFPVWETDVGRIGALICMDSSVLEASRLVGLGGADILCMPIMGDMRASVYQPGQPNFNHELWKSIQRTRAMDNQLNMVVCRNYGVGSCVINRKGDVLAWNGGQQPWVTATVRTDDGYRLWNGSGHRDVCWMQRRPHLYGALADPWDRGPLDSRVRGDEPPR